MRSLFSRTLRRLRDALVRLAVRVWPLQWKRPLTVTFRDADIIAAGGPLPFPDQRGTYETPDVTISGGAVPPLPAFVACPGALVIYSSWAEVVPNCAGFQGPGAANNPVVQRALQNANAVAARIPCEHDCPKRVDEIWRGWMCGGNPLIAIGAVELKITCLVEG